MKADMANFKYTPKDIYEADFGAKMRGYDKEEVDEMLDNIILDYETYASELLRLEEENEFLKNRVADLEAGHGGVGGPQTQAADLDQTQRFDPFTPQSVAAAKPEVQAKIPEPSNFDLLKRINRLERAVFGPGASEEQ